MQLLDITSVRNKALGLVTSAMLMLLLSWQSNFKTTFLEKSFVAASQSVADATEVSVDFSDFDPAIPVTAFQFGELFGWLEVIVALQFTPFSHTFIPQSRAPPVFL